MCTFRLKLWGPWQTFRASFTGRNIQQFFDEAEENPVHSISSKTIGICHPTKKDLKVNQPHETPCHLLCSTTKLETQLHCHDKMLAKLGKYLTCVTDRPTCLDQEQPGVFFHLTSCQHPGGLKGS